MSRLVCVPASPILLLLAIFIPTGIHPVEASGEWVDPEKEPKAGEVRKFKIAPCVEMEFCWIPGGVAQLGSPKAEREAVAIQIRDDNIDVTLIADLDDEAELKRGKFKTKGFWLGKNPVTQAEWKAVMGDKPSYFDGIKENKAKGLNTARFPVDNVSWDDCQKFLERANKCQDATTLFGGTGKLVLPHEDEWEYAARGGKGNKQAYYFGDALNGTQANCDGNYPFGTATKGQCLERTCAVDFTNEGKYEKHPWGLCHLHGNVWQWCDNKYEKSNNRVVHGGSWNLVARLCRAAYRNGQEPEWRSSSIGFRVCFRLD